jgi:hypothetical protein
MGKRRSGSFRGGAARPEYTDASSADISTSAAQGVHKLFEQYLHKKAGAFPGPGLFSAINDSFTFTNGGYEHWTGQSLSGFQTSYSGGVFASTSQDSAVYNVITGCQYFKIINSGRYQFDIKGAGGSSPYTQNYTGGNGAWVRATFDLSAGAFLRLVVGVRGGRFNYTAGAGGASAVFKVSSLTDTSAITATSDIYGIAGGGGGAGNSGGNGKNASTNLTGTGIAGYGYGAGSLGNGGTGGGGWGTGGAGYLYSGSGGTGNHSSWSGAVNSSPVGSSNPKGSDYSHTYNSFDSTSANSCYGAPGGFGGGGAGQCNGGGGGGGAGGGGCGSGGGGNYVGTGTTGYVSGSYYGTGGAGGAAYGGAGSNGSIEITRIS